jgi:hypothetical protein
MAWLVPAAALSGQGNIRSFNVIRGWLQSGVQRAHDHERWKTRGGDWLAAGRKRAAGRKGVG